LGKAGGLTDCPHCAQVVELQCHCLEAFPKAREVWLRVIHLVQHYYSDCNLHWGSVVWSSLEKAIAGYDNEPHRHVIRINGGHVNISSQLFVTMRQASEDLWLLWELLNSTTIWIIWKVKCFKVFENKTILVVECVKDIWFELIHTLKGQYGTLEETESKRKKFHV
jgi:hypothetical protein